ncbi:unnamed protein product [Cochlearia groenlandica]
MQIILSFLMMVPPHASNMSIFLITTFAIFIVSTAITKPSISTNNAHPPQDSNSQDLDSSYNMDSKSFLPKLYGDYGFWNPTPVYGGGFPYPGPVPHGSLSPRQKHKKRK